MDLTGNLGIDTVIQKLGHELLEIRCRSLHSIISKLEHGLLREADLIQERMLFVYLLEWFNFQPCPLQEDVLKLLLSLSKHASVCDTLESLGATQFLSDLRKDVEQGVKPMLDALLDRMFRVTDCSLRAGEHCTYREASMHGEKESHSYAGIQSEYRSNASSYFCENTHEDTGKVTQSSSEQGKAVEGFPFTRFPGFPWHFLTVTDRHVLSSTSSSLCSPNPHLVQNACLFLLDVVFKDFPAEIFLQRPTILNTLWTLLGTRPSGNLVITVCECLRYITENLISRVIYFQDPAMYCPRQGLPVWSMGLHVDKEGGRHIRGGFLSRMEADGQRQQRHGGDGKEVNSSTSLSHTTNSSMHDTHSSDFMFTDEDISIDEDQAAPMQLSQISTEHFCTALLKFATPLLQTDSAPLFLKVCEVATSCIKLFQHILDWEALWNCSSAAAQEIQLEMTGIFESIGKAILYHYHLYSPESTYNNQHNVIDVQQGSSKFESKYDAVYHRLAFNACSTFTLSFLKEVLPAQMACSHVKGALCTALFVMACDEPLALLRDDVHDAAESYLKYCDEEKAQIVTGLRHVMKSLSCACQLMRECGAADKKIEFCVELAQQSIGCLSYYRVKDLISTFVHVISEACNEKSPSSSQQSTTGGPSQVAHEILLQLLAHSTTRIRSESYKACLGVVQSFFDEAGAAHSRRDGVLKFLMNGDVLYEICLHGISDSSTLVSSPAQDLILHLLRGRIIMDEQMWISFKKLVVPLLAVLQAFQGEIDLLKTAIFGLVGVTTNAMETSVKIQCLVRALMVKQRSVRSIASVILSQALQSIYENDINRQGILPVIASKTSNIVGLTDLLMIDSPISLASGGVSSSGQTIGLFHDDAIVRALGIFRSQSIESSVRKSALQQLAVMLTDPNLHKIFLKIDGLSSIKSHLVGLVINNSVLTEAERAETDACVTIIKSITLWDREVHSNLFDDVEILLALLRTCDLCRLSSVSLPLAVSTLGLLLFCDVIQECKIEEKGELPKLPSLPAALTTRYQIPFSSPTHDVVSIHRVSNFAILQGCCDPLKSGPTEFAMLIHLFLMRHNQDITQTVKDMQEQLKTDGPTQSGEMSLITKVTFVQADCMALVYSHPSSCVSHLTASLAEARSHDSVRHFLSLLRLVLESFPEPFVDILLRCESWRGVLGKFLIMAPLCAEDENLLFEVVNLLNTLFKVEYNTRPCGQGCGNGQNDTLEWIINICTPEEFMQRSLTTEKPLFLLLKSTDTQSEPLASSIEQRQSEYLSLIIRRQLCKVTLSMLSHVARRLHCIDNQSLVRKFQVALCQFLLVRLKIADAPQFYDLPSMEVSLECLLHIAASHPGWTTSEVLGWRDGHTHATNPEAALCKQLTSTLLEVVSAFHIESRGSSKSYMGKGVSRSATLSIVSLAYETLNGNFNVQEIKAWLASCHHQPTPAQDNKTLHGLTNSLYSWMLPLWSARDPRIRHSGMTLAVALTRSVEGCIALASSFEECHGGLWSMSFGVFDDESECSAVREQAAALLSNLVSHEFSIDADTQESPAWIGPVVRNERGQVLLGTPALVLLLQRFKFSKCLTDMVSNYYSRPVIQPMMTICAPVMQNQSPATVTQNDSNIPGHVKNNTPANSNVFGLTIEQPVRKPDQIFRDPESSQGSLHSFGSTLTAEWRAVCTPPLITNVCRFLRNTIALAGDDVMALLEQNDIIPKLARLVDVRSLVSSMKEVESGSGWSPSRKARQRSHALSLICQYIETCKIVQLHAVREKNTGRFLCCDYQFLMDLLSLLNLLSPSVDWDQHFSDLHISIMDLISFLTQVNQGYYGDMVAGILSNDSSSVVTAMQRLLTTEENAKLLLSALTFLHRVLACVIVHDKDTKDFATVFEKVICARVIEIFALFLTRPCTEENFTFLSTTSKSLQLLFAISPLAKDAGMSSGFLETLLSEMKTLLTKLELYRLNEASELKSCTNGRSASSVKDCEPIVRNVVIILRIMSNFLHQSGEVKVTACRLGLGSILTKLLRWAPSHPCLLETILRLASCYSASCNVACSDLAAGACGQSSFTKHVIVIAKELSVQVVSGIGVKTDFLVLMYNLLRNMSISSECRSIMWKSSFLTTFQRVSDRGRHPRCTKQQAVLLLCWLKLLHSLSFHMDGQLNILKAADILEILTEIWKMKKANCSLVVVILRNLCFHGPSKHRISSSKNVICLLEEELAHDVSTESPMLAASALHALLADSHKSKVHLKRFGLHILLQKMLCRRAQLEDQVGSRDIFYKSLEGVLQILRS